MGLSVGLASQVVGPSGSISIIPAVSLVAIIGGAISMGMLFGAVRRLVQDRESDRNEQAKENREIKQEIKELRQDMLTQERRQ